MRADCILLAFYLDEIVEVIDALQKDRNRLTIHVLHNASSRSERVQNHLLLALKGNKIDSVSFFPTNIAAAAFGAFFDAQPTPLDAPYTVVSDGDILPDEGWLTETINILENHSNVFSSGLSVFRGDEGPNYKNYVPPDSVHEDYIVQRLGWTMKTFRRNEFRAFLDFRQKSDLLFHDHEVYMYARHKGMISVLAKNSRADHLRYRHLKDVKYSSEKAKLGDPWDHGFSSPFRFFTKQNELLFPAMPVRRNRHFWRKLILHNAESSPCEAVLSFRYLDGSVRMRHAPVIEPRSESTHELFCCSAAHIVSKRGNSIKSFSVDLFPDQPNVVEV